VDRRSSARIPTPAGPGYEQWVVDLIGDSNVQRHMNPTNCRGRAAMEAAQVIPCTRMEAFRTCLSDVRADCDVCVVSCVTNFITSTASCDTISLRIDQTVKDFFSLISVECLKFPDRKYIVSPPMYRKAPLWYRDGVSQVLTRFSLGYEAAAPKNLLLLSSFQSPAFESDGVHLNAYSGLEFVLHLFESSEKLLKTLAADVDVRECKALESNRLLGDRVVALEQGLLSLTSAHDLKAAIDAELHDYRANERLEDSFVISGLKGLAAACPG